MRMEFEGVAREPEGNRSGEAAPHPAAVPVLAPAPASDQRSGWPAEAPSQAGPRANDRGSAGAVAAEIQTRRRTVLIVDDEPLNVRVFAEALKDEYDVRVARTGASAIRTAGLSNPPDLVLLDVTMPDLSGHQVCRILKSREETRDIPVIFVTGRDQVTDETEGLAEGAVDFLVKPVPMPILRARVRTHMELRRRTEMLAALTATDALTGIANRRHFDDSLGREWRRCLRRGSPLGLVMVDVDFFKPYNDTYGHAQGDDCLRRVAQAVASGVLRSGDVAARFGGEEFALVLPETDGPGSATVAERVRQAVEGLGIPHEASTVKSTVTVSLGVAATVPVPRGAPLTELFAAADRALYLAKHGGRNRVVVAPEVRPDEEHPESPGGALR